MDSPEAQFTFTRMLQFHVNELSEAIIMILDLLWLAGHVGEIDHQFRRRRTIALAERLHELADGLPPPLPAQGFRDAAAHVANRSYVAAWDEYNRALADLAPGLAQMVTPRTTIG